MAEKKSGIFGLIGVPAVYNAVQFAAGATLYREAMTAEFIKPFAGCSIVDIGCGTGEYVHHIARRCSDFRYLGFDTDDGYIAHAVRAFAGRPNVRFYCKAIGSEDLPAIGGADIVVAAGVMHHLDDALVVSMLELAKSALKPGGRLITYDPGKFQDMSAFERFFVAFDRGRSIRFEREYAELIARVFPVYRSHVRYLTYYKSRNIIFECLTTTSPTESKTSG